jgi:hypothetical protein
VLDERASLATYIDTVQAAKTFSPTRAGWRPDPRRNEVMAKWTIWAKDLDGEVEIDANSVTVSEYATVFYDAGNKIIGVVSNAQLIVTKKTDAKT